MKRKKFKIGLLHLFLILFLQNRSNRKIMALIVIQIKIHTINSTY